MKLREVVILDAALNVIATACEWTTLHVSVAAGISKSIVYHYFASKKDLLHRAFDYYSAQNRPAAVIAFDLAVWATMRRDLILQTKVRAHRADERANLTLEFDDQVEAWLAQAMRVGLKLMQELGEKVDEDAINKLFRDLVFRHRALMRSPEAKAGVDQELSA